MTRYLHTMYRITDPEKSRAFYESLGLEFRREFPIVREGELEATNYFFGVPGQEEELELTFNHDGRSYELGSAYVRQEPLQRLARRPMAKLEVVPSRTGGTAERLLGHYVEGRGILGTPGRMAALVTKSFVFLGEGSDTGVGLPPGGGYGGKMFRAFDKKTGKIVWETELPAGVSNSPMTYMVNGKQYILVAVSGRQFPGEYVALAIP